MSPGPQTPPPSPRRPSSSFPQTSLLTSSPCSSERVLTSCISIWFDSSRVADQKQLQCIVRTPPPQDQSCLPKTPSFDWKFSIEKSFCFLVWVLRPNLSFYLQLQTHPHPLRKQSTHRCAPVKPLSVDSAPPPICAAQYFRPQPVHLWPIKRILMI